jgi:hypothetical protein
MTDESDNLLEPKTNRTPSEIGREVFRLVRKHGSVRVSEGESEWDLQISVDEDE